MDDKQEYKTGELARALKVNPNTIRSWADIASDLLSPRATAAKRTYTLDDGLILATIGELRSQGLSFEAIRDAIANGQRIESMPHVPGRQEHERKQDEGIVLQSEYQGVLSLLDQERSYRQRVEQELERAITHRDKLQQRLETETSDIRQGWRSEVNTLNKQIIDLQHEKGIIEGRLQEVERQRPSVMYWLAVLVLLVMAAIFITTAVLVTMGRAG